MSPYSLVAAPLAVMVKGPPDGGGSQRSSSSHSSQTGSVYPRLSKTPQNLQRPHQHPQAAERKGARTPTVLARP